MNRTKSPDMKVTFQPQEIRPPTRKQLILFMFSGRMKMAKVLLTRSLRLALSFSVIGTGCLWPQDYVVLPELPPKRNRPPRILENTLSPAAYFSTGNQSDCGLVELAAFVQDFDDTDFIWVKWYLNPQGQADEVARLEQRLALNSESKISREPATWRLSTVEGGLLSQPGIYRAELLIADGPLIGRVPVNETVSLSDGGTIENPAYTDSATFVIEVEDRSCQ